MPLPTTQWPAGSVAVDSGLFSCNIIKAYYRQTSTTFMFQPCHIQVTICQHNQRRPQLSRPP